MTEIAQLSFEEAMKALEQVVRELESGDVPLEKSIRLYEDGAALKKHCERKLTEAEEKVRLLVLDAEGNPAGARPAEGL